MAEQQFYKRSRLSSRDGDTPDEVSFGTPNKGASALRRADDALSDIDSVLADNDQAMSGINADSTNSDTGSNDALSGSDLSAAESADAPSPTEADIAEASKVDPDQLGEGYSGGKQKARGRFSRRQKMIGGGAVGLVGGGTIFTLLMFAPVLRLESYLQRINNRAFAYASEAVGDRTSHLFKNYMTSRILSMEGCTTVRSIDCKANYANKGVASRLFAQWQDSRVEEKIFDKLGFSIESTTNPNRQAGVHKFTIRDRRGQSIRFSGVEDYDRLVSGQFTGGKRELGREIRIALKDATRWQDVMQRRSVRSYLTRKHGIKNWCFLACKQRDELDLKIGDAKTKLKTAFVERFVYPMSGKYGFIMDCLIGGKPNDAACSLDALRNKGIDETRVPDAVVKRLIKDFEEAPDLNLTQIVLKELLAKVMTRTSAQTAVSAIPVAGQIYFGLVVVDTFDRLDHFVESGGLGHYAAEVNASQYLTYYTAMRSFGDEVKSHAVSMDEISEVMGQFDGPNGAEDSKVYQAYNKTGPAVASLFGQKAYAQSTEGDDSYKCANGEPIPEDEYVCEEKRMNRTYAIEDYRNNRVVDGIVDTLENYDCIHREIAGHCAPGASPRSYIRPFLDTIDEVTSAVSGIVSDTVMATIRALPGIGSVIKYVEEKAADLLQGLFGKVFPLPIGIDSPGREKYEGLEAGADVAASQFGQGGYTESGEAYGLGAPALSEAEASEVYQDYLAQSNYEYRHSSLIARLTDLENPRSAASQVIKDVPTSPSRATQNFASMIVNPFKMLGSIFGSLSRPVNAQQAVAQNDINAFAITRYGYPANDPAITRDPAELTPEFCEKAKAQHDLSAYENPETGFEEYSVANPCLLEEVATEAASALFTNN